MAANPFELRSISDDRGRTAARRGRRGPTLGNVAVGSDLGAALFGRIGPLTQLALAVAPARPEPRGCGGESVRTAEHLGRPWSYGRASGTTRANARAKRFAGRPAQDAVFLGRGAEGPCAWRFGLVGTEEGGRGGPLRLALRAIGARRRGGTENPLLTLRAGTLRAGTLRAGTLRAGMLRAGVGRAGTLRMPIRAAAALLGGIRAPSFPLQQGFGRMLATQWTGPRRAMHANSSLNASRINRMA